LEKVKASLNRCLERSFEGAEEDDEEDDDEGTLWEWCNEVVKNEVDEEREFETEKLSRLVEDVLLVPKGLTRLDLP
jgi:hypothetical protein